MQSPNDVTNEELFALYTNEQDPEQKEYLYNFFFERNLRMLHFIVHKHQFTGIPDEELFSLAQFGMLDAFNRFQPEKGVKFSTFAFVVIKADIFNYYERKQKKLTSTVSIDAPLSATSESSLATFAEYFEANVNVETECAQLEVFRHIRAIATEVLSEQERAVFMYQFQESTLNQTEIGNRMGVSQMQVSRLAKRANTKIRNHLLAKGYTKELVFAN